MKMFHKTAFKVLYTIEEMQRFYTSAAPYKSFKN